MTLALQFNDTVDLVLRQQIGFDIVDSGATCEVFRCLPIITRQEDSLSVNALKACYHRIGGRSDHVGESDNADMFAIDSCQHGDLALTSQALNDLSRLHRELHATLTKIFLTAAEHLRTRNDSSDTLAGLHTEVVDLCRAECRFTSVVDNGSAKRVLTPRLSGGSQPQQIVGVKGCRRNHIGDVQPAESQRSGLVEGNNIRLAHLLQGFAGLHDDAVFRRLPYGCHYRGWRRQHQGARTEDNQHRHGADHVACRNEGGYSNQHCQGYEVACPLVGDPLHWRLLGLGVFNHANELLK